MAAQDALFALECLPSKVLDFALEDGAEPAECVLHLTNNGSESVAFKVKTTKPKRYLVRPNQGVVAPSEDLPVSIVLLAHDKVGLISEFMQTGGCNETNKFMVQALPLQGESATAGAVPPGLWKEAKARVQQKKLVVHFTFPRPSIPPSSAETLKQASNGVRDAIAGDSSRSRFATGTEDGLQGGAGGDGSDMSQDQMWAQAAELRRKYDDLVSFTINLTAEKDLIQRSLGATKEDLAREQQARKLLETKMMEPGARRPAGSVAGSTSPSESRSGFSLFFVLIVAALALFAGQWTAANGYPLLLGSESI
ncbi:conserved unknown protein [Ectocarpus siliculosus]|uniref:MSP domain-containing protein n=1 Tax=Ectocarpus siliculosus TaxID=2880 RepID=D8LLY4_ECTSI|nr:conserved unknown protein [Ectocarpus siliculosus]|eukprot:CBN77198.1 conserved unknown protein [Ectocarpus siliculosus]